MSIRYIIVPLAMCFGLLGCAVEAGDEPTGEAELALGETTCETATADPQTKPIQPGTSSYSFSPDNTYNPSGCPVQWVAEFTGTSTASFLTHVLWQGTLPSTSATCTASHLTIGVYRYVSGAWSTTIDTATLNGTWSGSCSFSGSEPAISGADKVRVAGDAYTGCGSHCATHAKVAVGLQVPM